jgi:hypothetical protein
MMDGNHLDEAALATLAGLENVVDVRFSPEDTTQGKPAVLRLKFKGSTEKQTMKTITLKVREALTKSLENLCCDVVASLEHPVVMENNELTSRTEEYIGKIRFCQKVNRRSLSPTRLDGEKLNPDSFSSESDILLLDS